MSQSTASKLAAQRAADEKARADRLAALARKAMLISAIVGLVIVWCVDLYASWVHGSGLALRHGQPLLIAYGLPVGIDGLMLTGSMGCLAQPGVWLHRVIFALGALATVTANVLSVQRGDVVSYGIAGVVGASLVGSAVALERLLLPRTTDPRDAKVKALTAELRVARKALRDTGALVKSPRAVKAAQSRVTDPDATVSLSPVTA